jgi:dTDP-4-dehydrorhamnose 3,5-epimerase
MAHGFQTLEDNTDVLYQMTDYYAPQLGCGFRWNEPAFAIEWPIAGELIMHSRDRAYPDFDPISFAARIRATRP